MKTETASSKLPKDSPEYLEKLRHSCAHVMAQAVQELFPGTKITIGPAIENGFYYDFDSKHAFTPDDLARIEKRMLEIARGNHRFIRHEVTREESRAYWTKRGENFKVEILDGLEGPVTHYQHDTFTDLCRGNHLDSTEDVRWLKLTHVSGAYWRGSEKNPMLQRIYGTAWGSKEALDAYLKQMEEAKRRDHRKLGLELGLFSVHEEVGGGLIHWHPKGAALRYELEQYIRGLLKEDGYDFVYTPHISSEKLYEISGHLANYAELMYGAMEIEGQSFRSKPMNCPNHIMIYKSGLHSYRELPIRLTEFGTVYRFERSGVLHGLLRVRGFTQDDAHIFCREDQIEGETVKLLRLARRVYKDCGFGEVKAFLATRPTQAVGEPELWERAGQALRKVMEAEGLPFEVDEGGGAFYGPKIDLKVKDAIGREWQLCTIQVDFNLPRRFGVTFRSSAGKDEYAVMIHRAIFGSFERFLGVLIEHFAGVFPLWLAPVQMKFLTVTDDQLPYAEELARQWRAAGFRVLVDSRPEKIGHKIREATLEKVPYMAIIGAQEAEKKEISLRRHDGSQAAPAPAGRILESLAKEKDARSLTPSADLVFTARKPK